MKNIYDDLSSMDLATYEARDLAQNRPLCRLMSLHRALVVLHATVGLDCVCVLRHSLMRLTFDSSLSYAFSTLNCWMGARKSIRPVKVEW